MPRPRQHGSTQPAGPTHIQPVLDRIGSAQASAQRPGEITRPPASAPLTPAGVRLHSRRDRPTPAATVRVTPDTAIALAATSLEHSHIAVGRPDAWTLSPGLGHAYVRQSRRPAEGPLQLLYAGEVAPRVSDRIAAHQR